MKESTARAMEHLETATEGVRLWVAYCQHMGADDDYHGRFKVTVYRAKLTRTRRVNIFLGYGSSARSLEVSVTLTVGVRTWAGLAPEAFRCIREVRVTSDTPAYWSRATHCFVHHLTRNFENVVAVGLLWRFHTEPPVPSRCFFARMTRRCWRYTARQCIAVIANSEALGLPNFVTKYNGKPVLINRSGHCESK